MIHDLGLVTDQPWTQRLQCGQGLPADTPTGAGPPPVITLGQLSGCSEGRNQHHRQRAWAQPALLSAAEQLRLQRWARILAPARNQCATSTNPG